MMRCEEARERLSELDPRETPAGDLAAHLEACPACTAWCAFQDGLDEGVRRAIAESAPARLPFPVMPVRSPHWPWAAAAAILLLAGGFGVREILGPSASLPPPFLSLPAPGHQPLAGALALLPGGGRLELSGEAAVRLSDDGEALVLSRGRCWLETGDLPVRVDVAGGLRVSAGAELELRVLDEGPGLASLLLGQALAGEGASLEISVLAGTVEGAGLRIPAGRKVRLGAGGAAAPEPLGEADLSRIEGWRAERLEGVASRRQRQGLRLEPGLPLAIAEEEGDPAAPRVLAAGLRARGAHLLLRMPGAAGVSIGNLPALRDGAWHRLAVRAGDGRVEAFLDGRRILRAPAVPSERVGRGFSVTALGGAVDLKDLRTGRDAR